MRARSSGILAVVTVLGAMLGAGTLTPRAFAQPLADAVARASNIGAAETKAIEDHLAIHIKDFTSGDPEKIRRARNALVNPLLEDGVSVPFRLEYSKQLSSAKLGDLCKDKNETIAINALRLAGEVAENESIGFVESGFSDTRQAVRYAAIFAAGRVFEQMMPESRAVAATSTRLELLVASVTKVLNKDKEDALIVDAASRALLAAARVNRPRYDAVGKSASIEVAKGLAARVAKAGADDMVLIDAGHRAAEQFAGVLAGVGGAQVDKEARTQAAALGGELAAWVARRINDGKVPQVLRGDEKGEEAKKREARKPFGNILATAENTVLSALKASGATVQGARLVPAFEVGDRSGDANVVVQINDWLVKTILAKAPFDLTGDRFKTK
jgi:hypothetical protein